MPAFVRRCVSFFAATIASAFCSYIAPACAQSVATFYAQNNLTLLVATDAGGGYDVYSRALAPHYRDHLPGRPNIVVQNMPGAAGLIATNWEYNSAPRNGSQLLATYSALIDSNLVGNTQARFDIKKFNWIGSIAQSPLVCVTWQTSPYRDIRQMIGVPMTVSSTGTAGKTATVPLILNEVLGTKFKVISGYSATGANLALERGEVDAICGAGLSTLEGSNPEWFVDKKINIVAQIGLTTPEELKGVPNVLDLVTGKDRDIFEYGAILEAMGRPYVGPPGIPPARLAALRWGFDETMKDAAFVADMGKLRLNVSPMTAVEMEQWISRLYSFPPDTVQRVARLYGILNN